MLKKFLVTTSLVLAFVLPSLTLAQTNAKDQQVIRFMKDFCKKENNFIDPICQIWCKQVRGIPFYENSCDVALTNYCGRNNDVEECKCVNTSDLIKNVNKSSLPLILSMWK